MIRAAILLPILLAGCGNGEQGILFESRNTKPGPPFACRIGVPHADYPSWRQEKAQLDQANNLLAFCMAQWEASK